MKLVGKVCPALYVYTMRKNIIKCSQCDMEFPGGYEYRMHWEEVHFYPYLSRDGFDSEKALGKSDK